MSFTVKIPLLFTISHWTQNILDANRNKWSFFLFKKKGNLNAWEIPFPWTFYCEKSNCVWKNTQNLPKKMHKSVNCSVCAWEKSDYTNFAVEFLLQPTVKSLLNCNKVKILSKRMKINRNGGEREREKILPVWIFAPSPSKLGDPFQNSIIWSNDILTLESILSIKTWSRLRLILDGIVKITFCNANLFWVVVWCSKKKCYWCLSCYPYNYVKLTEPFIYIKHIQYGRKHSGRVLYGFC